MTELATNAEKLADGARQIPAFKDLSLPGVKEKVAQILNMIGRAESIFSTYSAHDISHVDAMLAMLDWLVPPSTQDAMTPVDWLLTVLAVYLHDLGMVVTSREYRERMDSEDFRDFLKKLGSGPDGQEYLARSDKMEPDEKERFFYQEFIRERHAQRIREWITGRHSCRWGTGVKAFADEIAKILDDLPARFREHLAAVSESHHKDNLDRREYFPLYQHYGGPAEASANVQYAAMLLRTVDLLHVTKDRTPSVTYKTLALSDPKGVDEWKKQTGTFSVRMATREFDADDPDSHVILVGADFDEERPFFALTEYLVYANEQTHQSKRWADASQQTADAKNYHFPWHSVTGDIRVQGNEPLAMTFELDRGRLLDLLVGHTIYNDPTVAVRELLQNAIDAVRYQHHLESRDGNGNVQGQPPMGRVLVRWAPDERELVVEDNGVGMDLDVIMHHLMRVGASFYATTQFEHEHPDFTPISRFGIGILTCFMISDDIEIVTCRADGGHRIKLTQVKAEYLLKKLDAGDPALRGLEPHGTRVILKLRSSVDLEKTSMMDIVKYWIVLPACEVLFSQKGLAVQRIGYESVTNALDHYHNRDEARTGVIEEVETREISRSIDGATYDLAYAVYKRYAPEWNFLTMQDPEAPAVCIEGIRADNRLPCYGRLSTSDGHLWLDPPRGSLCALLSVTGNRRFRTTVSRTTLERDEEYLEVGDLCAELLFDHVRAEVDRIAAEPGGPLSRASSAARWLYRTLVGRMAPAPRRLAAELYATLPLIVVETIETDTEQTRTDRKMLSLTQMKGLQLFWTVESRVADYLGIISRDLGKEVPLNEFLATLAPEQLDPSVTPIISDAHQFADEILRSHEVDSVRYSRSDQQTVLGWCRRQHELVELRAESDGTPAVGLELFDQLGISLSYPSSFSRFIHLANSASMSICTAPLDGDVDEVHGVRTRIALILQAQSPLARIWEALLQSMWDCAETTGDTREMLAHALVVMVLSDSWGTHRPGLRRETLLQDLFGSSGQGPTKRRLLWQELAPIIGRALANQGVDIDIPEDLRDMVGESHQWFDASRYWRDWSKAPEE